MLADVERHFDVLLRCKGRDKVEGLKYHTNLVVAYGSEFSLGHAGDIHPVNQDLAARRVIESSNNTKQCALARTRWALNGNKLAAKNLEADALEYINALTP